MNTNNPPFTVTKVTDSSGYDAQRGAHRTKQVHYKLADGTTSYVELPLDQATPEQVHQALTQAAEHHAAIMSLQPGVPPQSGMAEPGPFG